MAETFDLDEDYINSYEPLRKSCGYVAKGTVLFQGKPVEIFEAHGDTLADAAEEARANADEIYKRLKRAKPSRPSKADKDAWAKMDKGPKEER